MADHAALAATAKRLIDANGRSVTLVQHGADPQDSEKPWRGLSQYSRAKVTGLAVFVGLDAENPDSTKRKGQMMLFAGVDDMGLALEEFDVVVDGGVAWKIVTAEVIAPGATRMLYKFEVKR